MTIGADWVEVYEGVREDVSEDPDNIETNYRNAVDRIIEALQDRDPPTAEIMDRLHTAYWDLVEATAE